MRRLLLTTCLWLLLTAPLLAQASLLEELGQSLREDIGSAASPARLVVTPEPELNRRLERSALDDATPLLESRDHRMGFFLMSVGEGADSGLGLGVGFSF